MTSTAAVFRRWVALALGCGLLGCGGPARPDLSTWRASWTRVRALVPGEPEFGSWQTTSRCTALLAGIRNAHDALLPAPDASLDAAVDAWLRRAEGLAFDCPIGPAQRQAREAAFSELAVLEAEVEAGLRKANNG